MRLAIASYLAVMAGFLGELYSTRKTSCFWYTRFSCTVRSKVSLPPLAIHAKPALHINQQWTVFYRFNRLHSSSGIAKMPGHAIGLKFRPLPSITLHAEFIMKHVATPGGFWVAGTVRF